MDLAQGLFQRLLELVEVVEGMGRHLVENREVRDYREYREYREFRAHLLLRDDRGYLLHRVDPE